MKVVTPYRPFTPESLEHERLGAFDWLAAIEMLAASVRRCGGQTIALTDLHTKVPVSAIRFETREPRLMLWLLEVMLKYLSSPAFDRDTVMITPDALVFEDLSPYFFADLGIIVRLDPKFSAIPILNSVQWWRHRAKPRLIAFYTEVLAIARALPEEWLVWGADSEPLRQLLQPLSPGVHQRAGLRVALLPTTWVMDGISGPIMRRLEEGESIDWPPPLPILDFRSSRKQFMRAYYNATLGAPVGGQDG